VDDYLAWALAQPDVPRADLIDGKIFAHAAKRIAHLRTKHKAAAALEAAIRAARFSRQGAFVSTTRTAVPAITVPE